MEAAAIDYEAHIPLFPLPNAVLFPGVVQPLHIFETRYRQMMAWTLARQQLIALAFLEPGWKADYYSRPAVRPIVCVGRIRAHEIVEDGKYNLLLQGEARARIVGERREQLFRVAMLEPVLVPDADAARDAEQRAALAAHLQSRLLRGTPIAGIVRDLMERDAPTALLVDALAFATVPDVAFKQQLLEVASPSCRAQALLHWLDAQAPVAPRREWPPRPTVN